MFRNNNCATVQVLKIRYSAWFVSINSPLVRPHHAAQETTAKPQNRSTVEDEFGREHLEDPTSDRPDKIYVKIADAQRNFYGKWEILLTNGQRWEQTDSRTVPLPDDAEYYIERGVFNNFFLGREDDTRRIRVRRVED